jgi:hypothetical protein
MRPGLLFVNAVLLILSIGQSREAPCRPIPGLESLLATTRVLWLGEMHGTVESPAFLANATCLALRAGREVTVALEIPAEEQPRVDTFLASSGLERDLARLLESPFWRSEYQDGRRSQAMLLLLSRMRELGAGRRLRVLLIDQLAFQTRPAERDQAMAEAVAKASAETPRGIVIVLTGNVHARVARGSPWDPEYESAAYRLTHLKPQLAVKALDVSYQGGSAWVCTTASSSSCQVREVKGNPAAGGEGVTLYPAVTGAFHGLYAVGMLTASPPAWKPSS